MRALQPAIIDELDVRAEIDPADEVATRIAFLQDYLRACCDARGDVRAIPSGPWDDWIERDRDAINVEKAAMLVRGDEGMPPSMLRAIGLG